MPSVSPLRCFLVLTGCALASALPAAESSPPEPAAVRAALARATTFLQSIAVEGGYVWRYSLDLQQRAGERPVTPTQIWIQPPGTPAVGAALLRTYQATGDDVHREAALAAADALARGQLESGGWDYLVDFARGAATQWYRRSDAGRLAPEEAARRRNVSTYDDDTSQSALRFLVLASTTIATGDTPRERRIREARDHGLAKLVEAQRPNGGWPQRWGGRAPSPAEYPVRPARYPEEYPREHPTHDYTGYYTLNDHAHRDCVLTLLDAARRLERPDLRAAALKGGDFLLLAQMPEPQPVWAQQYNRDLEPAWARAFEPPCVSANESAAAVRLLVDLYLESGDDKYLAPLPRAVAWFRRSAVGPGVWARMYELRTNVPIYGDRDGRIKYRLEDLSPERQRGYSWSGSYGVESAIRHYERTEARRAAGRPPTRPAEATPLTGAAAQKRAAELAPAVAAALAAQDVAGRWVDTRGSTPMLRSELFIENLDGLSEYLSLQR